ncbi:MAG TPA: hypothetical protein VFD45_02805 [Patescibacteria group bacterium]|nr:hypothetical protein [Patescibacteria group bacterium]
MERKKVYGNLALDLDRKDNLGSAAFRIEKGQRATQEEARDDLLSYLGEYRFKLPTYSYKLHFAKQEGRFHLRDRHKLEPMVIKAKRAVNEKTFRGQPVEREVAEKEGLEKLDEMLSFAGEDCNIFWASPPGPKEQGYGDYGFIFVGKIKRITEKEKEIDMTAIRVESPEITQFNKALSDVSGIDFKYTRAEEFLSSPLVLRGVESRIRAALGNFVIETNQLVFERFKRDTAKIKPLIDRFVLAETAEEKLVLFNTIENCVVELEEGENLFSLGKNLLIEAGEINIRALAARYGDKKAPTVQGSCGSTGTESSNIFNNKGSVSSLLKEENDLMKCVTCPFCHEKVDAQLTEGKITCPSCKESANR